MLSQPDFVQHSLELNLFFMRIFREHSIFMEAAFTQNNQGLAIQAEGFKNEFSNLLLETINLANGVINPHVLNSGEIITQFTVNAEKMTEYFTGICIDTEVSRLELALQPNPLLIVSPMLIEQVTALNQKAITLTTALAQYKANLEQNVLACRIFTFNYPSMAHHILEETKFYLEMINLIQSRQTLNPIKEVIKQEAFWTHIMEEHAEFIRGMLDPEEEKLFELAHKFVKEFKELTKKARTMTEQTTILPELTRITYHKTIELRNFKAEGTEGRLSCKVKAVSLPLLNDHVLREANYYLRVLRTFLGLLR